MESKILTPLQEIVLSGLFRHGLAEEGAFLTGGTALSEFYLRHRESDDLDIFTRKEGVLQAMEEKCVDAVKSMGLKCMVNRSNEAMKELIVGARHEEETDLVIHLATDVPAQMAPVEERKGVLVDSLEDISVNKVCAILGRGYSGESKDYCDMYFILNDTRFDLDYLIQRARAKEGSFDNEEGILAFAVALRIVEKVQKMPRMVRSLSLEGMKEYLVPLADHLIERLRPAG